MARRFGCVGFGNADPTARSCSAITTYAHYFMGLLRLKSLPANGETFEETERSHTAKQRWQQVLEEGRCLARRPCPVVRRLACSFRWVGSLVSLSLASMRSELVLVLLFILPLCLSTLQQRFLNLLAMLLVITRKIALFLGIFNLQ